MAVSPGQRFVRYSVEVLIGEGGMGRVYRAFDTRLQRPVALKVLHPIGGDEGESVATALREARAAAAIAHPNATAVYDASEIDGTAFIAMELVAGTSLRALIGGPPVPLSTRLRWLVDVAAALGAAHRMGVVHRDVKPENVMVRHDGLVKVLDFGVARRTVIDAADTEGSAPGPRPSPSGHPSGARIAGTPAYMAPEQVRGEDIDGRADQFAWGVLGYELLTGRLPWKTARDVVGFIAAVVSEEPAAPGTVVSGIPPAVDAAIVRALAKNPAHRFPTMAAAAAELAPSTGTSLSVAAVAPVPLTDTEQASARALDLAPPAPAPATVVAAPPPSLPGGEDRAPRPPSRVATTEGGLAPFTRPSGSWSLPDLSQPSSRRPPLTPPRSPREAPREGQPSSSGRVPFPDARPRPPPSRPRRPFGPGFHEPDFEGEVDLEAQVALLPSDATCKGMFCLDILQQASRVTTEGEVFRLAQLPERRYVAFRDYPLAENMRLTVAAARALYPRYPLGEGLRRVGQTMFDAVLATHIGRALFGILGRDVEPILLTGPKAFKVMLNLGKVTAEKTSFRTFTFHAKGFPAFLETFQIGVLEGVLRHCGERGRIRIALEDLGTGVVELRLL